MYYRLQTASRFPCGLNQPVLAVWRLELSCVVYPYGLLDGDELGLPLGLVEGEPDGEPEGLVEGVPSDGDVLGLPEGDVLGEPDGLADGLPEGDVLGVPSTGSYILPKILNLQFGTP